MAAPTPPSALGTIVVGDILEITGADILDRTGSPERPFPMGDAASWSPGCVRWRGGPLQLERSASGNVLVQHGRFNRSQAFAISGRASSAFRLPGSFTASGPALRFRAATGWSCWLAAGPACRLEFQPLTETTGQFRFTGEGERFVFAVAADTEDGRARGLLEEALAGPGTVSGKAEADWFAFFRDQLPPYPYPDESWKGLYEACAYVLRSNRVEYGHPPLSSPFTCPSKFTYRHQWLWDSVFAAFGLRWLKTPDVLRELDNVLEHLGPDGLLPHEIFHHPIAARHFWPQSAGAGSSIAAPPLLGLGVDRIAEATGNVEIRKRALPVLHGFVDWFFRALDADGDGLVALRHTHESSWDNSPRWDAAMTGPARDLRPVETVDTNCLLACDLQRLGRWSRELGDAGLAAEFDRRSQRTAEAIRSVLWDEADRFFYDVDEKTHEKVRVKTPAAFFAFLGGIAAPEQEASLIGHLTNPDEFWTPWPVPVVARNEPSFNPKDMWRGPTWVNINGMVIEGLRQRGRSDLAREMTERTLNMMLSQGEPSVREWYHPETGEGLGALNYGWSAGVALDLILGFPAQRG